MIDLVASDGDVAATTDTTTTTTTRVEIDDRAGARVRRVVVAEGDHEVDLLAPVADDAAPWSSGWGSFPMAPWAGRVRHGRFDFHDDRVALRLNHEDGGERGDGGGPLSPSEPPVFGRVDPASRRHAIHGTVFTRAWTIERRAGDRCELSCRLQGALGWPYAGTARQSIVVRPRSVTFELSVEPDDGVEFPATIGWHPWFAAPDRLEFDPERRYELDEIGIPTGRLVEPGSGPYDDCFTNVAPATLYYSRPVAPTLTVASDCDHLVVYDKLDRATCLEPQSGPPDAFNLGPPVATSDHPVRRTMTWSW